MMFVMIGNSHFVCLKCRRSIKVWNRQSMWREETTSCATCGAAMICLGKQFTTPRKRNDAAWKKLEWMIQNGWRGWHWPTQPKMNLSEVQESLASQKRKAEKVAQERKESESLEEQRRAAKYNASRSKTAKSRLRADLKRQEEYQLRALVEAQNKLDSL